VRQEVERLGGQVARNRDVAVATLALAEELKPTTIDAILATSDLEIGLELLARRSPLVPKVDGGEHSRLSFGMRSQNQTHVASHAVDRAGREDEQ
jgi:hypothetical protein